MTAAGFLLITGLIFFFIMDLSGDLTNEASGTEITKETKVVESEETEEAADPSSEKEKDMSKLKEGIAQEHEFWNDHLGHRDYKVYNVEKNHDELKERIKQTNELIKYADGTMKEDLISARSYIEDAIENNKVETLKQTHRYFHDLDMGLNGAEAKEFWGRTKTYGSERP